MKQLPSSWNAKKTNGIKQKIYVGGSPRDPLPSVHVVQFRKQGNLGKVSAPKYLAPTKDEAGIF